MAHSESGDHVTVPNNDVTQSIFANPGITISIPDFDMGQSLFATNPGITWQMLTNNSESIGNDVVLTSTTNDSYITIKEGNITVSHSTDSTSKLNSLRTGDDHSINARVAYNVTPCPVPVALYASVSSAGDNQLVEVPFQQSGARSRGKGAHVRSVGRSHVGTVPCRKSKSRSNEPKSQMQSTATTTPNPALECGVCGKQMSSKGYSRHILRHSKPNRRPYDCDVCGMSFRETWHLKSHSLIHSGEKPFPCKICDRSFRQYSSLRGHHLRAHRIDKGDYRCPGCGDPCCVRQHMDPGVRSDHGQLEKY